MPACEDSQWPGNSSGEGYLSEPVGLRDDWPLSPQPKDLRLRAPGRRGHAMDVPMSGRSVPRRAVSAA
jgi:hypothetical protein